MDREQDSRVVLHTHLVVRDDAHLLYGFFSERERELFRALIKVNGVGPRLALAIQSSVDSDSFVRCVRDNDIKALVALPGIGKKTAERLIVEMRDRLPDWNLADSIAAESSASQAVTDAEAALLGMGYRPVQVTSALAQLDDPDADAGALIRLALRRLSDA